MRPVSESEMARAVVDWLAAHGWDVYQEVQPRGEGPIADLVAVLGPRMIVVECKLSLGLRVLAQARGWIGHAHMVYVAVPQGPRRDSSFGFACEVASGFGIGVLTIIAGPGYPDPVRELVRPLIYRRAGAKLRSCLTEHHKTYAAAGNPEGRRWTPFQNTVWQLERFARERPGATLKEAIDSIHTHYSSPAVARAALSNLIRAGVVAGLRLERHGRMIRVFPATQKGTLR